MNDLHARSHSVRRMLAISAAVAGLSLGGVLTACGSSRGSLQAGHVPAVLHLGAAGSRPNAAGTADSKMMPMRPTEFQFDGTMPDLGTTAAAYALSGGTGDAAFVAKLAAALGITATARALPADQGGGWQAGSSDYTGPVVTVGQWGMRQWWFTTPAAATSGVSCTTATSPAPTAPVPPDATSVQPADGKVEPCATPAPTPNLPSQAAAIAAAKQLASSMGVDGNSYDWTVFPNDWNITVNGALLVDGLATDLTVSYTFGANAELLYGGGNLGQATSLDTYPIVSVADGVHRLSDPSGPWFSFGGPMVMARGGAVAVDVAGNAEGGTSATGAASIPQPSGVDPVAPPVSISIGTLPTDSKPVDTVPMNTVPVDTTPYVVHLTGVKLVLSSVYTADGKQLLLPAYSFTSSDGGEYRVLAVEASFLDTSTTTSSTMPGGSAVTGSSGGGSTSSSGSAGTVVVGTGTIGTIDKPTTGTGG